MFWKAFTAVLGVVAAFIFVVAVIFVLVAAGV